MFKPEQALILIRRFSRCISSYRLSNVNDSSVYRAFVRFTALALGKVQKEMGNILPTTHRDSRN